MSIEAENEYHRLDGGNGSGVKENVNYVFVHV